MLTGGRSSFSLGVPGVYYHAWVFLEPTGNNWGLYVESQIRLSCSSLILTQGHCKQKVLPNSLRMNQCNAQNRCRGLNAENDVDKVFIHKCLENFHFFQLKTPPSNPIQSNPVLVFPGNSGDDGVVLAGGRVRGGGGEAGGE